MPSVIAYGELGDKIAVGEAAYGKTNFICDAKRFIAMSYDDFKEDKRTMYSLPYYVVKGDEGRAVIDLLDRL